MKLYMNAFVLPNFLSSLIPTWQASGKIFRAIYDGEGLF